MHRTTISQACAKSPSSELALGGELAHVLARRDVVRAIRLVDEADSVAERTALDITQAAPLESFVTALSGSTDLMVAAGAAVVVVADRAGGEEWEGGDGLTLVRRITQIAGAAVIVCAGARQRELVERGVRELAVDPRRLIGSAPEAFAAAARAIVGLEANVSPRDVALTVVGSPPERFVVPWEDATIGGFAVTRMLQEPARRRVSARLTALWPPGPYALAAGAATVIDALVGRSRRLACCFVTRAEGAGDPARTTGLPVRLGPFGVEQIVMPHLNAHDRVVLENAMAS